MKHNKRPLAFKVSAIYLAEQRKQPRIWEYPNRLLGYWLKTKDSPSESIALPARTVRMAFTSQKAPSSPSGKEVWAIRLMTKI